MQIDERKIAVFIDFENVAMGVRESRYGNFDIDLVLKRLVEKGKITVKRAYSDWHRYTEFKRAFHQAAIELIDVPQSRYSGKNSADIRMVVDALDLSYQRDHIDTFVLVSGDSDFSPLVSKLREYGRYVIGMGVKQSSSDLLINNCDEFIFYEDLVRPSTENRTLAPKLNGLPHKKAEALRLVVETFEALQREGKEVIYGSVIKQTLVRKRPSFNESYFGYPSFSRLLEDAAENKLLQLTKEQKSGGYIVNLSGDGTGTETPAEEPAESTLSGGESPPPARKGSAPARTRSSRGRRQGAREKVKADPQAPVEATPAEQPADPPPPAEKKAARPRRRTSRSRTAAGKKAAAKVTEEAPAAQASAAPTPEVPAVPPDQAPAAAPPAQPAEGPSAAAAAPEDGKTSVKEPAPVEAAPAEPPAEPPPAAEKKTARPRRRTSRSRSAAGKKATAKAPKEAPAAQASAAPTPEVPAVPPDQAPAAAPPAQPAEGPSAAAAAPEDGKTSVKEPAPVEAAPAEPPAEPPPAAEKKAARPRRRTSRSRSAAASKKAAAKAPEEAPPAEASAAPVPEVHAGPPDQAPAAPPPAQPAEGPSAAAASPPSDASASATGSGSDGAAAPKRRRRTTTTRKRTTRGKTTRSRKKPAPEPESTPPQ